MRNQPPTPFSLEGNADQITRNFYGALRQEVTRGNPYLDSAEQAFVQSHYPVMMQGDRFPPPMVTTIYAQRRSPIIHAVLEDREPRVFDAGCGYGSESFLLAALGAKVLAVDFSARRTDIAKKRQPYYEELFGKKLDIDFAPADLNIYDPPLRELSLTWFGSVLGAIPDQESLLRRLCAATRVGGQVLISDMNLLNPLFLLKEWRRRKQATENSPEFAQQANFLDMVLRRNRQGARYFPVTEGEDPFDDAQFFWPKTLGQLLRNTGFEPSKASYHGFIPPRPGGPDLSRLEILFSRLPIIRYGGYFYLMAGRKAAE